MGKFKLARFKGSLFVVLACIGITVSAQNIEFGGMVGASNYSGDVSEQKMRMDQTNLAFGFLGRYNINQRWSFKGFVGYGKVSGADSLAAKAETRIRNTNFSSVIYEFSAQFEYNLVRNNLSNRGSKPLIPYLYAGVGMFNFNPKTIFNGEEYELQPLGTEGQGTTLYNDRKKYDLTTICFPMGIGLKKRITQNICVGIEIGARFTFTNYIDDVGGTYVNDKVVESSYGIVAGELSNRTPIGADGNHLAKEGDIRYTRAPLVKNDMYFIGGFSVSYILRGVGPGCPKL